MNLTREHPPSHGNNRKRRRSSAAYRRIRIDRLQLDGGTQTRAQLDQDAVEQYAEIMTGKTDRTLPPVIIYEDTANLLWLADGFHRVSAALKNGQKEIAAEVRLGTRLDALLHSLGANQTHGVRRTNADKRRSVEVALGEKALRQRSSREIAELCGVGHQLVDTVRREREGSAAIQLDDSSTSIADAKRLGADGKMRPASRPKLTKKTAPQMSESSIPDDQKQLNEALTTRTCSGDAGENVAGAGEVTSSVSDDRKTHEDKRTDANIGISAPLRTVVADCLDDENVGADASRESTPLQASSTATLPQATEETSASEIPEKTSASDETGGFLAIDGIRMLHDRSDDNEEGDVLKAPCPPNSATPMLNLQLRADFQGKTLRGTTIDVGSSGASNALNRSAQEFLGVTYPSVDLVRMLEATQPGEARPVVLLGGKGQGKSHLIAALCHALRDPAAANQWLVGWSHQLNRPEWQAIQLRTGSHVIVEALSNQQYKFLWKLIFDRHPHGNYIAGKWEGLGKDRTDVPSRQLMVELFQAGPTVLLLDEFQTWFDGLPNTAASPTQAWAFNFIQILSEIADSHPDLLTLVVSIRENGSQAFQQVRRVDPTIVNFQGDEARRDRQRLLLYRIFENRLHIPDDEIEALISVHVAEHLRLEAVPPSLHDTRRTEFAEAWPFSPMLMRLLEDQVLIATDAQENRDLIRILVELFKTRGGHSPVLTAADFLISGSNSIIPALLSSVASQFHRNLQQKALRNLEAVQTAVTESQMAAPNATEIISALWLRSLSVEKINGAEPAQLQVDITRAVPIDDNAFEAQLALIRENSFNIHPVGNRLVFKEAENAEGKLLVSAKNDKLFGDGRDLEQLANEIRYTLGGSEDVSRAYRIVVLRRNWRKDPWAELPEAERPDRWGDKLTLLVLPEFPESFDATLGPWLRDHVSQRRNTLRFLLPPRSAGHVFYDRNLLVYARAVLLATEWKSSDPVFSPLASSYQKEQLRPRLKSLFDSFALLDTWSFTAPESSRFVVEKHGATGDRIPPAIQKKIEDELFAPEDFETTTLEQAKRNGTLADLLAELQEPGLNGAHCIPWLGETPAKERLLKLCARGKVTLVVRGNETLQVRAGESEDDCWTRIKGKVGTGNDLKNTIIHLPGAIPQSGGATPSVVVSPGGGTGTNTVTGGTGTTAINEPSPPNPFAVGGGVIPGGNTPPTPSGTGGSTTATEGATPPSPPRQPFGCEPKTALNLQGEVEKWNIQPAAALHQIHLNVTAMTGAQLLALLKVLPSGIQYGLNLEKEQG